MAGHDRAGRVVAGDVSDPGGAVDGGRPWAQFNVNFGMSGGGAMTASVTEQPPSPKLAA